MYDYTPKQKETMSVHDATRFADPTRNRMRGAQADYARTRDAAGLLHEGPYKGKDHPLKNAGAIHPPERKEASYRSSTAFVPGKSFPATDPIGVNAATKPASASASRQKPLRRSVEPWSYSTNVNASVVKEHSREVVECHPKGQAVCSPDRTMSATASKMFNIGTDTSAVVNPITGRYSAPTSRRASIATVDELRSPATRARGIATNIPCPPSHHDVISYKHYNGGQSSFTPNYRRPVTPANNDFSVRTSQQSFSAAKSDYMRNKFYGNNSFIFSS